MSPYPIGYEVDYVEERSRLTTFFRLIMAIPLFLVGIVWAIGGIFCTIAAWFALLFTARYPEGLYNFNLGVTRYFTRIQGYTRYLTDVYPPFDTGEHPEYPIRLPAPGPLETYSRLKVFFRYILAIPVILINYALNLLANIAALLSWFVILFTGKQNAGLQDAINLGTAYGARLSAYMGLITESWPPFSPSENMPPPASAATP
jgi:hypothetical protein